MLTVLNPPEIQPNFKTNPAHKLCRFSTATATCKWMDTLVKCVTYVKTHNRAHNTIDIQVWQKQRQPLQISCITIVTIYETLLICFWFGLCVWNAQHFSVCWLSSFAVTTKLASMFLIFCSNFPLLHKFSTWFQFYTKKKKGNVCKCIFNNAKPQVYRKFFDSITWRRKESECYVRRFSYCSTHF